MNEFAIRVTNLGKKYSIKNTKSHFIFKEMLINFFLFWKKNKFLPEEFYALKNVSFEIKKGDTVGIIGRNGAGKSTLLKILSEVTEMTEGKVEINGKIASVLEIGMGIHPEITGRENIYISGAMLGLSKEFIEKKFEKIVDFSGLKKFIDSPVKHYSTGMYLRLAFSVVANIDADILLFDEVLNVGDASFRAQCENKILDLIAQKKTVILVSHNINDIYKLCDKVMYLEEGILKSFGNKNTINKYLNTVYNREVLNNYTVENSQLNKIEKEIVEDGIVLMKLYSYLISAGNEISDGIQFYRNKLKVRIDLENYTSQELQFGFILKSYENYITKVDTLDETKKIDLSQYKDKRISITIEMPEEFFLATGSYILSFFILKNDFSILYNDDFFLKIDPSIEISKSNETNSSLYSPIKIKTKFSVHIETHL